MYLTTNNMTLKLSITKNFKHYFSFSIVIITDLTNPSGKKRFDWCQRV